MKTAIVTGSNRGIGLELTRQLANKGYKVIAVCRSASDELKKLDVRIESGIDVSDPSKVKELKERLKGEKFDLLINNAGIARKSNLEDPNWDGIEELLQVNAIAPLRVAHALLPNLNRPGKIAMITSRMGSIADNTTGSAYGYRMSKAALNAAGMSLAQDLKEEKIAVALLHPGYVKTDMTEGKGMIDTVESAQGLIDRIEKDLSLETTGSFWHTNGERLPW